MRKIALMCIAIGVAFAADLPVASTSKPVAGEEISWTVSDFDRPCEDPVMLLAVFMPDTTLAAIIPGKPISEGWQFSYNIPIDAIFMAFTIEDSKGILLDEGGSHIGVPIYEASGKPRFRTNLNFARLILLSPMGGDSDRVRKLLEQEFIEYPMNWEAFAQMRQLQLMAGEIDEVSVAKEFDSLLAAEPDSSEMLHFTALEFKLSTLQYLSEGEKLVKICAEKYPESPYWSVYQSTIYLALSQIPGRLDHYEREIFPLLKGKAREAAYLFVITYAMENNNITHAEALMSDLLEEFPSTKIPTAGLLNYLQMKYRQPSSEWAAEVEEWSKRYPDNVELNMSLAYYYKDRDWKKATGYFRKAIKITDSPQPSIDFAEVAAQKGKNFAEARKYLLGSLAYVNMDRYRHLLVMENFDERWKILMANKALIYNSLGWLDYKSGDFDDAVKNFLLADSFQILLPGYEETIYTRLLTASEKAGNLEGRKTALLNLLAADPENRDYAVALADIYTVEHGSREGFKDWLDVASREISLRFRVNRPVMDFPLISPGGDTVYLSQFRGKVVALNFWSTTCVPCRQEIPELNELVDAYKDSQDVVFLGITYDNQDKVERFLKDNEFIYTVMYEQPGIEASRIFQVTAVPTNVVIDRQGNLQYQHVGFLPDIKDILGFEIDALLQEE